MQLAAGAHDPPAILSLTILPASVRFCLRLAVSGVAVAEPSGHSTHNTSRTRDPSRVAAAAAGAARGAWMIVVADDDDTKTESRRGRVRPASYSTWTSSLLAEGHQAQAAGAVR